MMNDIKITVHNKSQEDDGFETFNPMEDEYNNPDINCYKHGPGKDLDLSLQRPGYRDKKNNQVVYKIYVRRIPLGLTERGLENLFLNFGSPTNIKCLDRTRNEREGYCALIQFQTLREAENAIAALDRSPPFNLRVSFARSDAENERIKKQETETLELQRQFSMQRFNNTNTTESAATNESPFVVNRQVLRMFGRGSRGRLIMNANRDFSERKAGLKDCPWSNGIPDFRVRAGVMYDPKSTKYETSNRFLQNFVITAGGNSVRKVAVGRGFIPPVEHKEYSPSASQVNPQMESVGVDVLVPMQACVKCGSETIQKCSQCGTPYCSKVCQKEDFMRHKPACTPKESIDIAPDPNMHQSVKLVPLCQRAPGITPLPAPVHSFTRTWGRAEKNALRLLTNGKEARVEISMVEPGKYHGVLSFEDVYDMTEKLVYHMPSSLRHLPHDPSFWPSVGTMAAVRFDGSIWRGYILSTPHLGASTGYTVALCDKGKIASVEATDLLSLPSEYLSLPELTVTCEVVQGDPINVGAGHQLNLWVVSSTESETLAHIVDDVGQGICMVKMSPWVPSFVRDLNHVHIKPPCVVAITAYHHQHAFYVQPMGRNYREQLFTVMQRVAAVHVTSPPLNRPPCKGEMIACRYRKDGNFYRAVVNAAHSAQDYSVFFVDFGNIDSASLEDMKALPEDLIMCPCLAVKVSLKDVREGPLSEAAVVFLNRLVQKEQQFTLECPNLSVKGVELIFIEDNKSLNKQLNEFLMPEWQHSIQRGLEPHKGEVFMVENTNVLPLLKNGMKKGITSVVVSNVMDDGRVCVCPVDCPEVEHVLQTLAFQINEYCESTDQNTSYNPRVSEVCLAKYEDGLWYRAVNFETLTTTQSSRLFFLDFGNMETVEFKNIRRMVADFISAPTLMSMCQLDGMPDELTPEIIKRVRELVAVNKLYEGVEILQTVGKGEYKIYLPEVSPILKSELS